MGETTDKIETYMDQQRNHLASNLRELEDKVRSAADWQTHFRNHPLFAIGVAVSGGALLAALATRPTSRSKEPNRIVDRPSVHRDELRAHWNQIRSAGIAMAAQRMADYVDHLIPGFKEQMGKVASK